MKLFIAWSGERSKTVALALRKWLPYMFETIEPWVSSTDIAKGTRWAAEISGQLEHSNVGVVCLTPENMENPWLLFESGALVKKVKESRLCTLAIGMQKSAIKGPLSQFQHTELRKTDMLEFVRTLNSARETPRDNIDTLFERLWPDLDADLKKVAGSPREAEQPVKELLKYYRQKATEVKVNVMPPSADLFFNDRLVSTPRPYSIRVNPDADIVNTVSAAAANHFDWHSAISREDLERGTISIKLDNKTATEWERHVPRWLRDRRRYPKNPVLTRAIVTYLCFIEEFDDAVAEAEDALKLAPNWYMSYNAMGYALLTKGDLDDAVYYFRTTAAMNPDNFVGHYNLAAALCRKEEFSECIASLKRILSNQNTLRTFAEAEQDVEKDNDFDNIRSAAKFSGQFNDVLKQIDEAVRKLPSSPD